MVKLNRWIVGKGGNYISKTLLYNMSQDSWTYSRPLILCTPRFPSDLGLTSAATEVSVVLPLLKSREYRAPEFFLLLSEFWR